MDILDLDRKGPLNKGRVRRIIIEPDSQNADIEFELGYLDDEGTFKAIGTDHHHIADVPEVPATKDKEAVPARLDYSEFLSAFEGAKDPGVLAANVLADKSVIMKVGK
jgi:hypothetical protein